MNSTGGPWPVTVTVNGAAPGAGAAGVAGAGAVVATGDVAAVGGGFAQPAASRVKASRDLGGMHPGRASRRIVTNNRDRRLREAISPG
jgi:hypothetical protein